MAHMRDLQKLRNTKNSFQIKKSLNPHPVQLRLGEIKKIRGFNHQIDMLMSPQFFLPKLLEVEPLPTVDNYSNYLDSKELLTVRESQNRHEHPSVSQKLKLHKRGSSFAEADSHQQKKGRQTPQPGLTVSNFGIKFGSPQLCPHTSRITNLQSIRKQKISQLEIHQINPQFLRISKQSKGKKQKKNLQIQQNYLIGKKAFEILYPIGKGGFGKVWKVKSKRTGQIFAMKQMQKVKIINKKSINSVINERLLLADLHHPFIVNMKSSFQDRQNLYLVMDYLNGGDLRYHIGCKGKFNQIQTKFFLANIIIGLQYLHEHHIIHRDLKPENFVFDSDGYLRITDLGVSRIVKDDNSQDTSGTPGYMAPQVICHRNHTYTADYFALGVMGYQFMMGRRPYVGKNRKQIREHILSKQVEIKLDELPFRWSPKAADFINQLLQRNPEKRLGSNGIKQIKKHPWLLDIDWRSLQNKTLKSPYIPLSIQQDYENYKQQISQDTIDQNAEQTKMILRDSQVQSLFQGYDYQAKYHIRKNSLRSTNHSDSEHLSTSIRGSGSGK